MGKIKEVLATILRYIVVTIILGLAVFILTAIFKGICSLFRK